MDEHDCSYIDILKIDIEGSEKELFENPTPWVDKVGMIVIELHDHFKAGCSSSVYSSTKDFQVASCKGETTILLRKTDEPIKPLRATASTELGTVRQITGKPKLPCRILSVE